MNRIDVTIAEQDCAEGCRATERYCVVSTAIARLIPEASRIETNTTTIRFSLKAPDGGTVRYAYPTPPEVREYVRAFDAGEEPKPMTFALVDPQVVTKPPTPKGKAKTASMKPAGAARTRRSVRVFGEKAMVPA